MRTARNIATELLQLSPSVFSEHVVGLLPIRMTYIYIYLDISYVYIYILYKFTHTYVYRSLRISLQEH